MLVTRLDAWDPPGIAAAFEAGIVAFGRIGALVNNAGYGAYSELEARWEMELTTTWSKRVPELCAVPL